MIQTNRSPLIPVVFFLLLSSFFFSPVASAVRTYQFEDFQAVNVDRVSDDIYRGGQPHLDDLERLQALGVKTVINFKPNEHLEELAEVKRLGLHYIHIPWDAASYRARTSDYERIAARFLTEVTKTENHAVYAHCHLGRDRTGAMFAVYRISEDGWSSEQAIEEMKEFGFRVEDYSHLVAFIRAYAGNQQEVMGDVS